MGVIDRLFKWIGVATVIYLLIVAVHEMFHVSSAEKEGFEVKSVCFLGFNFKKTAFAWVEIENSLTGVYMTERDRKWDYFWYGWIEGGR